MGAKVLQTYRHTDPPTKRVLEEYSLLIKVEVLIKVNLALHFPI